jgi:hypothetical protein
MGRTIPSYRIAAEWEKSKWKPFNQELQEFEYESGRFIY